MIFLAWSIPSITISMWGIPLLCRKHLAYEWTEAQRKIRKFYFGMETIKKTHIICTSNISYTKKFEEKTVYDFFSFFFLIWFNIWRLAISVMHMLNWKNESSIKFCSLLRIIARNMLYSYYHWEWNEEPWKNWRVEILFYII